jgi:hypothetical protein
VLAFVDAGVDPAVLSPPVPAAGAPVAAEADAVIIVDVEPKIDPEVVADVVVVVVVWDDGARDGDPKEKPTLPALGGVDPSLLPGGTTPNPNGAGVVEVAAVPKANGDGFADEPNAPPDMMLGSGSDDDSAWPFSLSSADFVVVTEPNMLLGAPEELVASWNNLVPGATLKAKGPEAGLSFSLSFSSGAVLSEPNIEVFGALLKSRALVGPLPPPPKGEVLEGVVPLDENAPSEKVGFSKGVGSASFGAAGLDREDEDVAPVKLEKGEGAGLGSVDVVDEDENLKGDGSVVDDTGLGVNPPVAGAAELVRDPKPAKLVGGTGIAAGSDVAGLRKEDGAAGMEDLLGALEALCVLAREDLPS